MQHKPNILWICTDSQRWDTLGCYDNRFVRTPHADRLAQEGTTFENAFCQNPVCTPSRGSFLTGRYPVTNRLTRNGQVCPADLRLVTKVLHDAGYVCGLSGKLHLNACDQRFLQGPEWWKEPNKWWKGVEERIDDGYDEFYWDHGVHPEHASSEYMRWLRENNWPVERPQPRADCRFVDEGRPAKQHQSTWCANRAIGFMEAHANQPYPWLFSINIFDPHFPFDPPEEYLAPYLKILDDIPLPDFDEADLQERPLFHRRRYDKTRWAFPQMQERDHKMIRAAYWAMCDLIDVQLGRMIEALERTGQRENTLVIFVSDHGELLGDQGLYGKGPFFYEGAVRVPLLISWPGKITAGQRVEELVELTDLAPTLIEAAGLPCEAGMQGRSLWPILSGEPGSGHSRDDIFCEYLDSMPDQNNPPAICSMLRTPTHKIVRCHSLQDDDSGVAGELYDLRNDHEERRNLWDEAQYATLKSELLMRLSDRWAQTVDPQFPRVGAY